MPSGLPFLTRMRGAGGEVVDEVDALADLLALVVQALLAGLGVASWTT